MSGYKVIGVFWEDHISKISAEIPSNPDIAIGAPTLTVGILLQETEKSLLIAHDIERLDNVDYSTHTIIIKSTVIGRKEFGEIDLEDIRWKEA